MKILNFFQKMYFNLMVGSVILSKFKICLYFQVLIATTDSISNKVLGKPIKNITLLSISVTLLLDITSIITFFFCFFFIKYFRKHLNEQIFYVFPLKNHHDVLILKIMLMMPTIL